MSTEGAPVKTHAAILVLLPFLSLPAHARPLACASGPKESRTLAIKDFDGIRLQSVADLEISNGPNFSVTAVGPKPLLDDLHATASGGDLVVSFDNCRLELNNALVLKVTLPLLSRLHIEGAGDVSTKGTLKGKNLNLIVQGSGNVTAQLEYESASIEINGAGDVVFKGTAKSQSIAVRGSGNVENEELRTSSTSISISGSGDVEAFASDEATIQIMGSGDVSVSGSPKKVSRQILGSGNVTIR